MIIVTKNECIKHIFKIIEKVSDTLNIEYDFNSSDFKEKELT